MLTRYRTIAAPEAAGEIARMERVSDTPRPTTTVETAPNAYPTVRRPLSCNAGADNRNQYNNSVFLSPSQYYETVTQTDGCERLKVELDPADHVGSATYVSSDGRPGSSLARSVLCRRDVAYRDTVIAPSKWSLPTSFTSVIVGRADGFFRVCWPSSSSDDVLFSVKLER